MGETVQRFASQKEYREAVTAEFGADYQKYRRDDLRWMLAIMLAVSTIGILAMGVWNMQATNVTIGSLSRIEFLMSMIWMPNGLIIFFTIQSELAKRPKHKQLKQEVAEYEERFAPA